MRSGLLPAAAAAEAAVIPMRRTAEKTGFMVLVLVLVLTVER